MLHGGIPQRQDDASLGGEEQSRVDLAHNPTYNLLPWLHVAVTVMGWGLCCLHVLAMAVYLKLNPHSVKTFSKKY